MPILDGYEATNQIRTFIHSKRLPQPIIVAVTGHDGESYFQKAIKNGMNLMSPKPVDQGMMKDVF